MVVTNPDGQQAILPYRFLIEQAIEPDVALGLGGTRVMWAGDTGFYGLSLVNDTNVDLPYVYVQAGVIEQGTNQTVGAGMLLPPEETLTPEYNDFAI